MTAAPQDGGDELVDNSTRIAWWLFGVVATLWVLWLLAGQWLVGLLVTDAKLQEAGQFGDMFGAVNALFTALAFAAVTWTGFMQRFEMKLQRRELSDQRKELKLQREAVELQREEMERTRLVVAVQSFEATFFQMIELCRSLQRAFTIKIAQDVRTGQEATSALAEHCRNRILDPILKSVETSTPDVLRLLVGDEYETQLYSQHGRFLGPYFRALYHLFKLIDTQSALTPVQKRQYGNLARAHLSADDLVVLAVNACSNPGEGFRDYITRYGLLKHIEKGTSTRRLLDVVFDVRAFQGV